MTEAETIPHYRLDLLGDPSIRDLYKRRLEGKIDVDVGGSSSEKYARLKECVYAAAAEALGVKEGRRKPGWWSDEVAWCIDRKKMAYQK